MPGLPAEIVVTGDAWLTDRFQKYAEISAGISAVLGLSGPSALGAAGFPMRSIMRSDLFGGQEIESLVTSIEEGAVPASLFEVPEGFTEVPMQMGMPSMGTAR
jgi:hypothetical protein